VQPWASGVNYSVGNLVTWGGATYRARQSHTSLPGYPPPNIPALWELWPNGTTLSTSKVIVSVGEFLTVRANTGLGMPMYSVAVIDSATGQEQDEANPLFTPARSGPITAPGAAWTLTAARPGRATFSVRMSGEIYDPSCSCYRTATVTLVSASVHIRNTSLTPMPTPTCTAPPIAQPVIVAPIGVTAVPTGNGQVEISWAPGPGSLGGPTHFYVQRSLTSGGTLATVGVVSLTSPRFTDLGLMSGTRYYYRIHGASISDIGSPTACRWIYEFKGPSSVEVSAVP
jgi:hypothetical protein